MLILILIKHLKITEQKCFCIFSEVSESRTVRSDSLRPHGLCSPWNSLGQNPGMGRLSLLQEIFPTQGSNPGLPHCRQVLYQISHQGNPCDWLGVHIWLSLVGLKLEAEIKIKEAVSY